MALPLPLLLLLSALCLAPGAHSGSVGSKPASSAFEDFERETGLSALGDPLAGRAEDDEVVVIGEPDDPSSAELVALEQSVAGQDAVDGEVDEPPVRKVVFSYDTDHEHERDRRDRVAIPEFWLRCPAGFRRRGDACVPK